VAIDFATHKVAHLWYDGIWRSWELLGAAVATAAPGISSSASGRLDIFTRNAAGGAQQIYYDLNNGGWHTTWVALGGTTGTSALSAVSWGPGRIDVFGSSSSSKLEHHYTNNSGATWVNDVTLADATSSLSTVSVASRGYALLDLFFTAPNGHLVHETYDSDWTGGFDSGLVANTTAAVSWAPGRVDVFGYSSAASPIHGRWLNGDDVYTQHNNPQRTGLQAAERELNTQNVNTTHFGILKRLAVDGQVYAQPLFVGNVGGRNLLFVATEMNSVYAFDTDSYQKVWSLEAGLNHPLGFGVPNPQPDIGFHGNGGSNVDMTGITSTPVIDPAANRIYVEAFSAVNPSTGADVQMPTCPTADCPVLAQPPHVYRHKLYAINMTTGVIVSRR
jgi:hypothetical protein